MSEIKNNIPKEKLLGKQVFVMCTNHFFTGTLVSEDAEEIVLENSSIVFETGLIESAQWKLAEKMPMNQLRIKQALIESYGALNMDKQ